MIFKIIIILINKNNLKYKLWVFAHVKFVKGTKIKTSLKILKKFVLK